MKQYPSCVLALMMALLLNADGAESFAARV
jgi:hypothetical protein